MTCVAKFCFFFFFYICLCFLIPFLLFLPTRPPPSHPPTLTCNPLCVCVSSLHFYHNFVHVCVQEVAAFVPAFCCICFFGCRRHFFPCVFNRNCSGSILPLPPSPLLQASTFPPSLPPCLSFLSFFFPSLSAFSFSYPYLSFSFPGGK